MFANFRAAFNAPGLFFTIIALMLTIFTFAALGIMGYWAVDQASPVTNMQGRFIEWSKDDPDIAWIRWTGHRNRACPGTVNRWIVNGWVHALPTTSLPYPDGLPIGSMDNVIPIEIPHHLDGGMTLRTRVDYSCNPLQRIVPFSINLPDVQIPERPQTSLPRPSITPTPGLGPGPNG